MSGEPAAKKARCRDGEHEQHAIAATLAANPETKEARVWGKLQGKRKIRIGIRKQFMADFKTHGFGFVEGSCWTTHIDAETYKSRDSYKTRAQVYAAECQDSKTTEAKIRYACSFGKGKERLMTPRAGMKIRPARTSRSTTTRTT